MSILLRGTRTILATEIDVEKVEIKVLDVRKTAGLLLSWSCWRPMRRWSMVGVGSVTNSLLSMGAGCEPSSLPRIEAEIVGT